MSQPSVSIPALLESDQPRDTVLNAVLQSVLQQFNSETGAIHKLHAPTQLLRLLTQIGLPPQLVNVVSIIPVGKGIAGECVQKNRPVTIGNPQAEGGGALCVPIRNGDQIIGTLGIGTRREHEYSAAEINLLQDIANSLAIRLA